MTRSFTPSRLGLLALLTLAGCAASTEGGGDVVDSANAPGEVTGPEDIAEGGDGDTTTPATRAPFAYSATCNLPAAPPPESGVVLTEAFPNLILSYPLLLTHANDDSNRLFVIERFGFATMYAGAGVGVVIGAVIFFVWDARIEARARGPG